MGYLEFKKHVKIKRKLALMAFCLIMAIACIHAQKHANAQSPVERFANKQRAPITELTLTETPRLEGAQEKQTKADTDISKERTKPIQVAER